MSDLERWLQRQAARERRGVILEEGLLGDRLWQYAWYRLRWFFLSYVVESITHGVTVLFLFRGLAWDNFLLVLVATAVTSPHFGVLVGRARRAPRPRARPAPLREPAPYPADDRRLARPDVAHLGRTARPPRRLDRLEPARRELRAGRGLRRCPVRPPRSRPADPHLPLGRLRAAPRLQAAAGDPRAGGPATRGHARPLAARRRLGARLRRAAQHSADDGVQPALHAARLLLPRLCAAPGSAAGDDARRTPRRRARDLGGWLRPCRDGPRRPRGARASLQGGDRFPGAPRPLLRDADDSRRGGLGAASLLRPETSRAAAVHEPAKTLRAAHLAARLAARRRLSGPSRRRS